MYFFTVASKHLVSCYSLFSECVNVLKFAWTLTAAWYTQFQPIAAFPRNPLPRLCVWGAQVQPHLCIPPLDCHLSSHLIEVRATCQTFPVVFTTCRITQASGPTLPRGLEEEMSLLLSKANTFPLLEGFETAFDSISSPSALLSGTCHPFLVQHFPFLMCVELIHKTGTRGHFFCLRL